MTLAQTLDSSINNHGEKKDFLTILIAGQRFGIPILDIQDVLGKQEITRIPLSPPEIAGSLNLRGRIVTAIDVRCRLDMKSDDVSIENTQMSVVIEHKGELYSLVIDSVGQVLSLDNKEFEGVPPTLDNVLREISLGVYRLEGSLLIILDLPKLIDSIAN